MTSRFASALEAVNRLLNDCGIDCLLIGGQAAIYHGSERTTRDIDLTIWVSDEGVSALIARARSAGFETVQEDPEAAARNLRVLILVHRESGVQVDLMLAGSPFEDEVRGRACDSVVAGVQLRVIRADDLLVYKILASRDRDLFDAACILEKGGDRLDLGRVRRILRELGEALGREDLIATLDRLVSERLPAR